MKHHTHLISGAWAVALPIALAACGSSSPTPQLVDARRAYDEAASSEAAKLTPDKLLSARQALNQAEAEHRDDPGSPAEAHLGYVASRKAEMAVAYGKIALAQKDEREANARYDSELQKQAMGNRSELERAQSDLAAEQTRRAEAERRAAAALQSLSDVAKVAQEQRGTVITLPGAVLFPSGGARLSASAQQALDKVAQALGEQPQGAKLIVEGHSDSRGTDEGNRALSQRRAEAVRDYLVTHGVDAAQLEAVGRGEESPIADNDTAEGRATNRRVEIVVGNEAAAPQVTPAAKGGI